MSDDDPFPFAPRNTIYLVVLAQQSFGAADGRTDTRRSAPTKRKGRTVS